ncbi:Dnaja4 [Symbiodinium natans]|uniref:Dnaja4 protein n=1 Tax=Symbiodinium natans TaxID=878477 RepID=A0A812PWA5_9DINO|nr:Dnaja4 [Symbiodinium natans]
MFDFDDLSECEGSTSDEGANDATRPSPEKEVPPVPPDPLIELRERCERCGLCITWGPDAKQMAAMLQEATSWERYGICALKDECFKRRIPLDNLIERRDVLSRLSDVLVWEQMSLKQLQSECWRRKIPFVNRTRVSNIILLETENPHADGEGDLVRRLVQDAFPGATGPLPAGGVPGIWEPGEGSYSGAKGSRTEAQRVAAWTGAVAPGYDRHQTGESRGWSAPCGPPPGATSTKKGTGHTYTQPDPKPKPAPKAPGFASGFTSKAYGYSGFHGFPHDAWGSSNRAASPDEEPPGSEHYQVLGLRPGAPPPEVRKAYRQLALKLHPDKQTRDDGAHFKKVTAAYKALCELFDN